MPSPHDNRAGTPAEKTERLLEQPGGSLLVRPEYAGQAHCDWFRPQWWGASARPVASGGRGSAWFIQHDAGNWVLRHYSRGGMVARVSQRTYGYTGAERVRSFAEFRLLNRMVELGLPVPEPVAAFYQRRTAMAYQAAILVRTIPDAVTFADQLPDHPPRLWRDLGHLIRRFHDQGIDHPDLNCHNVLISRQSLYLIDFDKGQMRQGDVSSPWARKNLERFWRSVRKQGVEPSPEQRDAFDRGYYRVCL
ncbi:MAG: 3-deoxy-D-manno-octulosonic acid kinase [Oleiphilaceae bacterium]|nr:3-deoxy-D-manno-octulosonic acid kinase [Oleiphilaceae bacterium]